MGGRLTVGNLLDSSKPDSHEDWHDWVGAYVVAAYGLRNWRDAQWLLYWLEEEDQLVAFSLWMNERRWSDLLPEDPIEP